MTTALKNEMIKKGRVILNGPLDYLTSYSIPITFGVFGLAALTMQTLHGRLMNGETLLFVGFPWLLAVVSYLIKRSGLKLEKETLDLSGDQIHKVLHDVGEEHSWTIITETEDIIVADSIRLFMADNRITILLDGKDIYINARSTGGEFTLFRQGRLTDDFRLALRRRYFEIQHQKRLGTEASR